MTSTSQAESAAITKPTVVAGLGYPNGRIEESPEPTGDAGARAIVAAAMGDVSRGTK